ncbi:MAG: hypothetical protein ACO3JL_09405, partial [Myxococcota bacterium]
MSDLLLPPLEPAAAPPKAPESFVRRHATGLTVLCFFVAAGGLGVAPLPERVQPVRLQNPEDIQLILDRVLKKPRMTLAKMETPAIPLTEEREGEVVLDEGQSEQAGSPGETAPRLDPLGDVVLAPSAVGQHAPEPGTAMPDASPPTQTRRRDEGTPSKQVSAWRKLASKLGSKAVSVENPCVRFDAEGCTRTALDPFFVSLDAVDREQGGSHATVVTLGNSLIASDHVTDVVRARLVQRFGSGGPGFLLPDRLSKAGGRRVRTGRGDDSWEFHTFAHKPPRRTEFGFTGSMHESTKTGDRVVWKLAGSSRIRLFYLDHQDNPGFSLDVDGRPLQRVTSLRPGVPEDRLLEVELEKPGAQLRLTADGPGVVLYGVALAKDTPGVVWDTIGVPASDASMYVGTDEGIFRRQLQAREPSLVVVMVGGNEIRSLAYG